MGVTFEDISHSAGVTACKGTAQVSRVNPLNSVRDIAALTTADIVFIHDPQIDIPTDNAVILRLAE